MSNFVHKMYSTHMLEILASPNTCGFYSIDYDAMNPEEKNGFNTNNPNTRALRQNKNTQSPRTRGRKILHTTDSVERKMPTVGFDSFLPATLLHSLHNSGYRNVFEIM